MKQGRFIAVVGPSGVGKDSIIAGLARQNPALEPVRRTITRAPDLGGEDYNAVTVPVFEQMAQDGAFCLHWGAHGLYYGIPKTALRRVENSGECLANLSRGALADAVEVFAHLTVLNITASVEVLAQRLAARGRESDADITKRLSQASKPLPAGLRVLTISNDGPLTDTLTQAHSALQLVGV